MCKVFIDTNVFLGLYQENKDNMEKIFEDITKIKNSVVFVDQVYDEFIRNRDTILSKQINNVRDKKVPKLHVTSLIRSLDEFLELKEANDVFAEKHKNLITKITKIKDDLDEDIVYTKFCELYNDLSLTKYERTNTIIDCAYKRMLIGNPPIDSVKNTIGDQIIWETLISNLEDDLIFITFDGTYKNHITFLKDEYRRKVCKELIITDKVSVALNEIGVTPSKELIEFEDSRGYINFLKEDEVKDLLSHFAVEGLEISPSVLYDLFEKSNDDYYEFKELIGITTEIEDSYRKPSHSIHSDYITIYRKYFNPDFSPYIKEEERDD